MRRVIVETDADGAILAVSVQDAQNAETMATDLVLIGDDGRARPLAASVRFYRVGPWASALLEKWREGRYRVNMATGALMDDQGNTVAQEAPPPPSLADIRAALANATTIAGLRSALVDLIRRLE